MLSALLSACGSALNIENYNKLQTGQSYDEVKRIIGEPRVATKRSGYAVVSGVTTNMASISIL